MFLLYKWAHTAFWVLYTNKIVDYGGVRILNRHLSGKSQKFVLCWCTVGPIHGCGWTNIFDVGPALIQYVLTVMYCVCWAHKSVGLIWGQGVTDVVSTLEQHRVGTTNLWSLYPASQQTRDIVPMLVQCWFAVYDTAQRWTNNGTMYRVCWAWWAFHACLFHTWGRWMSYAISASRQTQHIEAMLGQRRRLWPSIEPGLVQCALGRDLGRAGTWSGDIDRDSACSSVVITALFKITKPFMQSTELQGSCLEMLPKFKMASRGQL